MWDSTQKKYFRVLSFIIILSTSLLPILDHNLPSYIGSYRFLWAPIWLISMGLLYPKLFLNKQIIFYLFYGLIFIEIFLNSIWAGMDEWNKGIVREEYYVFAVSISLIWYFRIEKDYVGLAILTKWSMIFIAITAILSINSSVIDPMYARNLAGGVYDSTQSEYFSKLGGGSYGFAGALIALFPIMVYYYKNVEISIFKRKYILIFGVICFTALLRMQIFANIVIALFTIILSLLGTKKRRLSFTLIWIFILIFILIPDSFYSDVLRSISHNFKQDSETYYKVNDMADYIVKGGYEGTEAGSRIARYPVLIKAFLSNPIFGNYVATHPADLTNGGHLYWMNKLCIFGLFGFVPYLLIHFFFIKSNLKYFHREYSFYYIISTFSIIILGLMKQLIGREMWITYFVLLPGLYYLPLLKKEN